MPLSALSFIPSALHPDILAQTSTDDVTTYLQQWLDECSTSKRKGTLPAGLYNISAPLYVTRFNVATFETNHIEGDGGGYTSAHAQTILNVSQLDGPALIVDKGRGVRITNIQITGQNTAVPATPTDDPADYLSPGVRNSRYSPHCAIAIDATVGNVPPDGGYPGLTYAGVPTTGSHQVIIEYMSIRNFAVSLMVSPGETVSADYILMHNCDLAGGDVVCSYGQGQTRNCVVSNCNIANARIAFGGVTHGKQEGVAPIMENNQIGFINRAFEFLNAFGGISMHACYLETLNMLGTFGTGFSRVKYPMRISDCTYKYVQTDNGKNAPVILDSQSSVLIDGTIFINNDQSAETMNFTGGEFEAKLEFHACTFLGEWRDQDNLKAAIGIQLNTAPCEFHNCQINSINDNNPRFLDNAESAAQILELVTSNIVISAPGEITFTLSTPAEGSQLTVGQLVIFQLDNQGISFRAPRAPALAIQSIDLGTGDIVTDMLFDDSAYRVDIQLAKLEAVVTVSAPI